MYTCEKPKGRLMKSLVILCSVLITSLMITGCGDNAEEEKFRKELMDKALNDDVRKIGQAFLIKNAEESDVHQTPSGLQYKVLVEGEGGSPTAADQVTVHYEGMRVDGHIFDSSYKRGSPAVFPLNRVIKGWTQGVSMMKKGAVWMLYIPSELAYGAISPSEDIPANSTLIFKIELIDFKAAE